MAVKPWRIISTPVSGTVVQIVVWDDLQANDTGLPKIVAEYSDKTVQIDGTTLGSGITIQGTLDPTELDAPGTGAGWDTLVDPQGNALAGITTEKVETVLEQVYLLRPNCAAGVVSARVFLLLGSTR